MLDTIPRPKLRDVIAERLKTYITTNRLKPGDRLPTETMLAEKFGISRLSLREATKSLEFLGIIESKTGVGLTVGRVDMQRVADHLCFHPALQDASPQQFIETRIIIEIGALPFLIRQMKSDPTIYESLTAINEELRRTRDLARFIELDVAFHRRLVESSGLSLLLAFSDLLVVFFQRFRESVQEADWGWGIDGHQRLVEHLAAGRLDAACEELQGQIRFHEQWLDSTSNPAHGAQSKGSSPGL
jgi:GntR family transcriptional regulator, transcriptional repressor for pyruvate dehydrogenase complex